MGVGGFLFAFSWTTSLRWGPPWAERDVVRIAGYPPLPGQPPRYFGFLPMKSRGCGPKWKHRPPFRRWPYMENAPTPPAGTFTKRRQIVSKKNRPDGPGRYGNRR